MMLHAIPRSFGPFFAMRLILGMLESCVAPILILIISMFYKKNEQVGTMRLDQSDRERSDDPRHVGKPDRVVLHDGTLPISPPSNTYS